MLPVLWILASALIMSEDSGSPELQIRAADGEVTIHAHNLPVSQILDRLSSATGMDVTYQGARPTTLVTMSVDGISEAEAILKLMEGLGVSYVFRTDATGQRVDLLIVSEPGMGKVVAPAASSRTAAGQPVIQHEEPIAEYDQPAFDPVVPEVGEGLGAAHLGNPNLRVLPGHAAQAPESDATGSSTAGIPNLPMAPNFPQGASYPSAPVFPQSASYPRH